MAIKNLLSTLTGGLLFTGQAPPRDPSSFNDIADTGQDLTKPGIFDASSWEPNDAAGDMAGKYFNNLASMRNGGIREQALGKLIGSLKGGGGSSPMKDSTPPEDITPIL